MCRFVLLSLLAGVLLLVQAEVNFMEKCDRLLHPRGLSCCNKKYISESIIDELKECMQEQTKPFSCETEICMAKKKGYASEEGTFDKTKLKALFEESETHDKELQKAIIEDCVDGDLSAYGPPEFCDLMKFNVCMNLHAIIACPDWSNDEHCKGSAEAAEECTKALA